MRPKTIHEAKRIYTEHRSFPPSDQCAYATTTGTPCPGTYPDFASYADSLDFTVRNEMSEFPVDSTIDRIIGEYLASDPLGETPMTPEEEEEASVNYPDGFSPVAQYMAGLSTEDMLQRGSAKSDSERPSIKDAAEDPDDLRDLLHRLVVRLSDIDDTLEDVVDTLDDVVDSINNKKVERSDTFNITVVVGPGTSKKDIEKAVDKAMQRARVQKARNRAGI